MTRQTKLLLLSIEILLALAIYAGLRSHVEQELDLTVRRNRSIAEAIARHASRYFTDMEAKQKEFSLRRLNDYLDEQLGRGKLFEDDLRRPASFEVYRIQDLKVGRVRLEILESIDYGRAYTVRRDSNNLTVSVPFTLEGKGEYYGIVRIPAPIARIYASLIERNMALYLVLGLLFVAQLVLATLVFAKRRREIIFEKGYLRDHALGALKLQRQILDGIIGDHEGLTDPVRGAPSPSAREREDDEKEAGEVSNVVRLADKTREK